MNFKLISLTKQLINLQSITSLQAISLKASIQLIIRLQITTYNQETLAPSTKNSISNLSQSQGLGHLKDAKANREHGYICRLKN